jgi:two-component system nitrate/nitrite response regulator NarL
VTTPTRNDVPGRIRIGVISGLCIAREALCILLERDTTFAVTYQGGPDSVSVGRLCESAPDVVLIDGSCRESLQSLRDLRKAYPDAALVVYGVQPIREVLLACARDGATVVASHDTSADAVVELVKSAARGHLDGEARLNATLLGELALLAPTGVTELSALTRREREVALAVAGGLTNKEIAQRFCISLATVKSHVHCILRKLGIDRRDQVLSRLRGAAAA